MNQSWRKICCFCGALNLFLSLQAQQIDQTSDIANGTSTQNFEQENITVDEALTNVKYHGQNDLIVKIFGNQSTTPNEDLSSESHSNFAPQLRLITPCTTPNDDQGFCMPLKNCSKLMDALEDESARHFLRNSRCSSRKDDLTNPKVCCGNYGNYKNLVPEDPFPKNCGRQSVVIRGRILGGKTAKLGEFPWMARLIHKHPYTEEKAFGCGGFLIAAKYVLTAAHCLASDNIGVLGPIFEVQLGEHNTETRIDCNTKNTKCADTPQVIRVKKSIPHPQYSVSSSNHHNDIGLIHLKKAVKFTNYVYPICLLKNVDLQHPTYWISGWGTTKRVAMSSVKMKVSLPHFPHSNCTELYNLANVVINDKQICAGGQKNKDSCTGDSGGPLMVEKENAHWFAAGVVSYGLGCGRVGWPGVYTNITSYYPWIESTMLKRAKSQPAAPS